jgi:GLPGLI family protein
MKSLKYLLSSVLLSISLAATAQHVRFITQGVIEYEKRINAFAIIKQEIKLWEDDSFSAKAFESYQKNNPQFKTLKSQLYFNGETTAFVPEEETIASTGGWFNFIQFQQANHVLSNLSAGTSKMQKKVFDETYFVSDSIRKINWKITNEFRNIAGYNCRRANALVMDSIYVVAFYTDEIAVSGGPESFSGLPGMILGLALPHEHITWFATSVSDQPVSNDKLKIPTKGKPVKNQQLFEILKGALKSWGKSAYQTFKWTML